MKKSKIPILVGAAQYRQSKDAVKPLDPLGLMVEASRMALSDSGVPRLEDLIDRVYVVNLFQWPYRDVPGMLAERLCIAPREKFYTAVGGNTPQVLVNKAARSLASGECRAVLMTGAEAFYALRRALKGEVVLDWPESEPPERIEGDNRSGISEIESRYDLFLPSYMYPLVETALRAATGHNPEEHRLQMGMLWERFARVAAQNPYAWIRDGATTEEIATPSVDNRYIGYPYTKRMNANINVDLSAALVMTTVGMAQELGIDSSRWVYPLAGIALDDIWFATQRPHLDRSPAIRSAARYSLEQAGLTVDQIDVFDLYSCFPCVVEIARREIGISDDDPRPLTVTGGLSFFGGPGNNYSMHAIASVVERIRENHGLKAMITANGYYLTKHAVGIYGGEPPIGPWYDQDKADMQEAIDAEALPEPVEKAFGSLTVEAYVIRHDKKGRPERGTVMGRLGNGRRALAHIDARKEDLETMENIELVGQTGAVRFDMDFGYNLVTFEKPKEFRRQNP
ncbi:MAG: acetyl-CoA acetyltransferase [Syntrophobacterales bacterium]|nr:MAG: acetyl-CoA acetyltransferase [Syntrophobacterales bacterium]